MKKSVKTTSKKTKNIKLTNEIDNDFLKPYSYPKEQILNKEVVKFLGEKFIDRLNTNVLKSAFGKNIVAFKEKEKRKVRSNSDTDFRIRFKFKGKDPQLNNADIKKIKDRLELIDIDFMNFPSTIFISKKTNLSKRKYNNDILVSIKNMISWNFEKSSIKKKTGNKNSKLRPVRVATIHGYLFKLKPTTIDFEKRIISIDEEKINDFFNKLTSRLLPILINIYHIKDDKLLYDINEDFYKNCIEL